MNRSTELAVVGAGPGGYAAAFLAADLGMRVTLIGREPSPGGVCLYTGCIPSKTLLHAAKLIKEARQARKWGIEFEDLSINLEKLRNWNFAFLTPNVTKRPNIQLLSTFLNDRRLRFQESSGKAISRLGR